MATNTRLNELIARWNEAHSRGAPLSPPELCRACPDLLPLFVAHLRAHVAQHGARAAALPLPPYNPRPADSAASAVLSSPGGSVATLQSVSGSLQARQESHGPPPLPHTIAEDSSPESATAGGAPPPLPSRSVDLSFLRPAQSADEIGRLGAYRILKILGAGGMGMVFQAEDVRLKRLVALKVILPHVARSDTARERFLREARLAASIEHDHIVPIYR